MKPFLLLFAVLFSQAVYAQSNQPSSDWGNLSRYSSANSELSMNEPNRIVFFGNSITEGWSNIRPDFFAENPSFVNRGIGGQTTPQMLVRFRQDVINLKPKVVVILAGINDIAQNTGYLPIPDIFDNIKSMAELARANKIKVVLCSVLPAYDFPWRPGLEPAHKVIELNQMIKDYCTEKNIIYVDYFSAMVDDRNGLDAKYQEDEVHPTSAGYAVMEPLVLEGIRKARMER